VSVYLVGAKNPETGRQIEAQMRADPHFHVAGFIDNDPAKLGTTFLGLPVLGGTEMTGQILRDDPDARFVNLITGSTTARFEVSRELADRGCDFTNLIHPDVDLEEVAIGVGNYIQNDVVVQAGVEIGNNSSIHIGALVAHETRIGHSVFVAHAVSISGEVTIDDGAFLGTNSTIVPRVRVGRWATIGAGAVVVRDVPDYATVVGNPSKVIRQGTPVHTSGDITVR
jgi:sugar O-acyltransferase (sialic acid O-acetyltransferase NeuD family)